MMNKLKFKGWLSKGNGEEGGEEHSKQREQYMQRCHGKKDVTFEDYCSWRIEENGIRYSQRAFQESEYAWMRVLVCDFDLHLKSKRKPGVRQGMVMWSGVPFDNHSRYTVDNSLEEGRGGYKKLVVKVQLWD